MTAHTVPGPRPSAVLAARYARALDIAVVVAAAGWQLAGAGPLLLAHLGSYSSDQFQVAAWCAIALIIAAGSVLLLRGSSRRETGWALAAAALVISTAAAAACPPAQMLETNWSWGAAGWVGVLVLLRRPLAELGVFLTLEALAMFAVLARDGLHQPNVAAFITVLAGSTGIQVAISVAARTLDVPAQQAEQAATREADIAARQAVADQIRSARQARWLELRATAEPLLSGLAAGTADPADLAVQRACAVEAARLRRLFAEADDTPDPLVHELHACADIAQRRGVAVDIETAAQSPRAQLPGIQLSEIQLSEIQLSGSQLPAVPPEGRRAITDLAITVLVNAISRVRVTVTGTVDGVIVSLVCDSPADPDLPRAPAGLVVDSQRDGQSLWVEARWNTA
jgi:hypothetical protein